LGIAKMKRALDTILKIIIAKPKTSERNGSKDLAERKGEEVRKSKAKNKKHRKRRKRAGRLRGSKRIRIK